LKSDHVSDLYRMIPRNQRKAFFVINERLYGPESTETFDSTGIKDGDTFKTHTGKFNVKYDLWNNNRKGLLKLQLEKPLSVEEIKALIVQEVAGKLKVY